MSFTELQKRLQGMNNKTVVVNFWATWCVPCVEELPGFEQLNKLYASKNVKVILVSLDFTSRIESNVIPFIQNRKIKSEVWHITDSDPNTWINQIDSSWSGAIPATVIYDSSHRKIKFNEGAMSFDELDKIVTGQRSMVDGQK